MPNKRSHVLAACFALCCLCGAGCSVDFSNSGSDGDAGSDAGPSKPDGSTNNECGGEVCGAGYVCAQDRCCPLLEQQEMSCADGADNDCDGRIDCDDLDCQQRPCEDGDPGTIGDTCVAGVCLGTPCTPTGLTEDQCADGDDNDCDGLADCADPDCDGSACNDGDANTKDDTCTAGNCAGVPCENVWVCDQCPTGDCVDVLTGQDHPGCGCAQSVAAPNCNVGLTYDVDCGDGINFCHYERREVTVDCNCRWECH